MNMFERKLEKAVMIENEEQSDKLLLPDNNKSEGVPHVPSHALFNELKPAIF